MRAASDARFDDWSAIDGVGSNSRDEDLGFGSETGQLDFVKATFFDLWITC